MRSWATIVVADFEAGADLVLLSRLAVLAADDGASTVHLVDQTGAVCGSIYASNGHLWQPEDFLVA